jgi:two-component system response regulator PhoP
MMSKATILVADDNVKYRESLRQLLELEGYQAIEAASQKEVREQLDKERPDLALLDLRFTDHENERDFSGLTMAKLAAQRGIPCIVITAYDTAEAARMALRSRGTEPLAEDFVPKREGPHAVLYAIEVVLNRINRSQESVPKTIEIDLERRLAYLHGESLRLSEYQYSLLAYLFARQGGVCSAKELIKAVYGEDLTTAQANADKRLERLVERAKAKIEIEPHKLPRLIKEHGRGYRLVC